MAASCGPQQCFYLPGDFETNEAVHQELLWMLRFVKASVAPIRLWMASLDTTARANLEAKLEEIIKNCEDVCELKKLASVLFDVIGEYNLAKRLRGFAALSRLEAMYKVPAHLLPPALPSEFADESRWHTGNDEEDKKAWIGHGYYWKHGSGDMNKVLRCQVFFHKRQQDISFSDYDMFEDRFVKLKNSRVICADYSLLRRDFPHICTQMSEQEIDKWLCSQAAYMSEGQLQRMKPNGDMNALLDFEGGSVMDYFDFGFKKSGIRQKGGGRAATFLVDSKYWFSKAGEPQCDMIDVKGVGTTSMQKSFEPSACGFLPLVDALKEFSYQHLIQHLAEREKTWWSTVQYYAIIDCGFGFKKDVANPATGFCGDRCVLLLRQRQSRCISAFDEIVYYSVVRQNVLKERFGTDVRKVLTKYGISSEQLPLALLPQSAHDDLTGEWNMQADASLTHVLDFSHFYILPRSSLAPVWRMSDTAVRLALKLGSEHLGVFKDKALCFAAFGTDNFDEAKAIFFKEKAKLQQDYKEVGRAGDRKPSHSWSWFLESDDSEVVKWCLIAGAPGNLDIASSLMRVLTDWLVIT